MLNAGLQGGGVSLQSALQISSHSTREEIIYPSITLSLDILFLSQVGLGQMGVEDDLQGLFLLSKTLSSSECATVDETLPCAVS